MKYTPIFYTSIGIVDVKENTDILQKYNGEWVRTKKEGAKGLISSMSRDNRVLESYPEIKKFLLNYFISLSSDILGLDQKFAISTSWLTKTEKSDETFLHNHRNSFWSGVYYYGEEYGEDSFLEFTNPLQERIKDNCFYMIPTKETKFSMMNADNPAIRVESKKNKLILFPSYIKHKIIHGNDNSLRYSLAFNIVPIGKYGLSDSTYDTSWFN